ncbi:uncharacterized protein Gasu_17760 [Galdieria sulphuraria]|uniref:Uncharacterized protein n=1 Tax=Galdieria sulphuraria TaxID=130081 RepID=M2X3L9_GALSU|nr:uncharacterized protein Gasu_17760 [Galdieria sulphuraria]EME31015.1 hypothetical protein Gasu_17760 [Galdieria sulphuraria]|eukprot:XP_005707535.1 hypothetical protein Gasu_17760 [Galdieria sulphuraria]
MDARSKDSLWQTLVIDEHIRKWKRNQNRIWLIQHYDAVECQYKPHAVQRAQVEWICHEMRPLERPVDILFMNGEGIFKIWLRELAFQMLEGAKRVRCLCKWKQENKICRLGLGMRKSEAKTFFYFWFGFYLVQLVWSEPLEATSFNQGRVPDICICSCCIYGGSKSTVCSAFSQMSTSVPDCDACTLTQCNVSFGKLCKVNATFTRAYCVERNSAFLKLVPYSFILFTVFMLLVASLRSTIRYYQSFRKASYDMVQ